MVVFMKLTSPGEKTQNKITTMNPWRPDNSLRLAFWLLWLTIFSTPAQAQFLNNLSIGNPVALAMGHAVTADPPGVDSIHFNPAGLADIKGKRYLLKLLAVDFKTSYSLGEPTLPTQERKQEFYNGTQNGLCSFTTDINECWGFDPLANTSGSTDDASAMMPFLGMTQIPLLVAPSGGIAIEDKGYGWTYGTAAYLAQGVGYIRDEDDPAAYQGVEVGLTRFTYFAPTIAIPVSDNLSIGFGLNVSYQGFYMDTKIRAPLDFIRFASTISSIPVFEDFAELDPYAPIGRLELELEDFVSVGMNFGLLWQPYEWLRLGLNYQPEASAHLKGNYKMKNSENFLNTTTKFSDGNIDDLLVLADGAPFNATAIESGSVKMEYIVPQNLSLGASIQLFPSLKLNVDAKWVEYSAWNSLDFEFSNNLDYLTLSSVINFFQESKVGNNADPDVMRLRRAYEDTWSFAIGMEYDLNHRWVLRAGYEPRTSVIPNSSTDLFIPLGELELYTLGLGYQWSNVTRIDAAIAYGKSETKTSSCASRNANSCIDGDVLYNPYYSQPFATEAETYLFALSFEKQF